MDVTGQDLGSDGSIVEPSFGRAPALHRDDRMEKAADDAAANPWWLYLLACRDGRSYAGIARDVEARFAAHVRGKGAKFTRANPPLQVLGARPYATKSQALRAEYALKQLEPAAKRRWAARWPWRAGCAVPVRGGRGGSVSLEPRPA